MFGSDGVAATNCRQPGSVVSWITGPGRLRRAARSPPFLCLAERVEDRHRDDRRLPAPPAPGPLPARGLGPLGCGFRVRLAGGGVHAPGACGDAPVLLAEFG